MRKIEIEVFSFSELDEKTQEKVLYEFCDVNLLDGWWWMDFVEDFNDEILAQYGLACKTVSFDLDYRKFDFVGLHITDRDKYRDKILETKPRFFRLLDIIDPTEIDVRAWPKQTRLLAELDKAKRHLSYNLSELKTHCLSALIKEYRYLTSREAIVEYFNDLNVEFLKNGDRFYE